MLGSIRILNRCRKNIQVVNCAQFKISLCFFHELLYEKSVTSVRNFDNVRTDGGNFDEKAVLDTMSCYENDWNRAFEFFMWVPQQCQFKHTVETYNKMINILGKFFEFELAWKLVDEMGADSENFPVHTTFGILFKRYAAAQLVEEAINAYHRSEEFGLKDRTNLFNLVDALCEYKHVIEAQDLCVLNDFDDSEVTKFHNLILRGWFKMGWWSKCREFWEEMERKGVHRDVYSYSIYMNILSKSGKPWKSVKLYKEMKKKRIKLDSVTYSTVLHAVGLCDGADGSLRILREMSDLGCKPNVVTYNTVIRILCESGRSRPARELVKEMRKNGCAPNAITFHHFFRSLNKPKEIMRLFERMVENGPSPTMDTYVMLIRKFGRWGFLQPVFTVWKKMEEQGLSPDASAYNAFIDALLQKGMVEMAQTYDEEMMAKGLSAKPRKELGTKFPDGLSEEEVGVD